MTRFYIATSSGFAIGNVRDSTSRGGGDRPQVEFMVLDRDYCHRRVASFVGYQTNIGRYTTTAARLAAEMCARRLNDSRAWTPDLQLAALKMLTRAGVPRGFQARAVGVSRWQATYWVRAGRVLRRNLRSHCVNGHRYTKANTYLRTDGARVCRKCAADRKRRYWVRRQRERNAK